MSASLQEISPTLPGGYPRSLIDPELTLRQQRWIEHYLATGNATEAARRAGYSGNESTLRTVGCQNTTKYHIRRRIEARLSEEKVSAPEVVQTLAAHMRADVTELYDADGSLTLDTIRARGLGHLIKKIKQKRRYETNAKGDTVPVDEIEVELNGQQSAALGLAKLMGLEQAPRENEHDATKQELLVAQVTETLLAAHAGADRSQIEAKVRAEFERRLESGSQSRL